MPARRINHDTTPPVSWPQNVSYLMKPRLSPRFPPSLIPLITQPPATKFQPRPVVHPPHISIKAINTLSHPAKGQNGLFAKKKIGPNELIIPYLGIIHASFLPDQPINENPSQGLTDGQLGTAQSDEHSESDYDLSLLRLSASDPRNPFPGYHISIGVDAANSGNSARFVNDYRGVGTAPNAEFRVGHGESGEMRMEVWSLKCGLNKGDEILVSYGKGWWNARNGG